MRVTVCANNVFTFLMKPNSNPLGKWKGTSALLFNYDRKVITPIRTADLFFSAVTTYERWLI